MALWMMDKGKSQKEQGKDEKQSISCSFLAEIDLKAINKQR